MANPTKLVQSDLTCMLRTPGEFTAEQVSQAILGTTVELLQQREGWVEVQTPDGYRGWVDGGELVDVPEGWNGPWVESDELMVNLRLRPSYLTPSVARAPLSARLPRVGVTDGFIEVLHPDGRRLFTETHRFRNGRSEGLVSSGDLVSTARRLLGAPYLWGGCTPMGLDCSGFVQLVYKLHGITLLRDAHQQAGLGQHAEQPGEGDLVFFHAPDNPGRITHVGLALDTETMIHARGSSHVRIDPFRGERYGRIYWGARRILGSPRAASRNENGERSDAT